MAKRPIILVALLLVVAVAAVMLWRASTREPMADFRDFPWTYITEAGVGSDESKVIIDRGEITGPASVIDPASGATAWPAFVHPDPKVVPLVDGKPVIFPLIPQGQGSRTPVITAIGRPLTQREIEHATRYFTREGRERMDAFTKEQKP